MTPIQRLGRSASVAALGWCDCAWPKPVARLVDEELVCEVCARPRRGRVVQVSPQDDAPAPPQRVHGRARDVLEALGRQPMRRVHRADRKGPAPWPAHPATLASLVRRRLATAERIVNRDGHPADEWAITDEGWRALAPEVRVAAVRYMAPVTGTTTVQSDSIDPGAPVMGDPDVEWTRDAKKRHETVKPTRRRRAA